MNQSLFFLCGFLTRTCIMKNNFSNIKVIIVQGYRMYHDDYELLSSYPSNCVDIFFTFREKDKTT